MHDRALLPYFFKASSDDDLRLRSVSVFFVALGVALSPFSKAFRAAFRRSISEAFSMGKFVFTVLAAGNAAERPLLVGRVFETS